MYERLNDIDTAFKYYKKTLTLKKINYNPNDLTSVEDMLNCYKRIGILQKQIGNFDKAIGCFSKCLEYARILYKFDSSQSNIPYIYNQMGMVYSIKKEDAKAIDFDDNFIYEELDKTPDKRSMPREQILREEALEAFYQWKNKADKIEY
jgi:tetratricopeptide (TPR) repeat protein